MKLSVKRENLLKGLMIVGRMVKQRATLPVLSNILIASDKGRLKLASTDLESAIVTWVGAKIDEDGAITMPARTLVDFVASSTDETIDVVAEGTDVRLKSSHYQVTIKGLAADEFPEIPQVKAGATAKIPAFEIKRAILAVAAAAALDETRPVLAGILMRAKKGKIVLVATDSYRLAEYQLDLKREIVLPDVIFPQRTANELARILPQDETEVEIQTGENQIQFTFDDVRFLTRQIEGAFPDYEQIIPKEFVATAQASLGEFSESVKTANIFAREAGNNVKLTLTDGNIAISAASSQIGDATANVKATTTGESLTIAFNARYILDALSVFQGEEVTIGFSGQLNPGLLSSKDIPGLKYVIMPLRNE